MSFKSILCLFCSCNSLCFIIWLYCPWLLNTLGTADHCTLYSHIFQMFEYVLVSITSSVSAFCKDSLLSVIFFFWFQRNWTYKFNLPCLKDILPYLCFFFYFKLRCCLLVYIFSFFLITRSCFCNHLNYKKIKKWIIGVHNLLNKGPLQNMRLNDHRSQRLGRTWTPSQKKVFWT